MNYGYQDSKEVGPGKQGGKFGLNTGVVTKFEYNPNAGKDGAEQDAIDLNMKDHQLSQNDQIIVESQYLPRCIHATLENKTMHIEIEKQMSLKIIGDTTILVESKTNDEELEMKINPDFIT